MKPSESRNRRPTHPVIYYDSDHHHRSLVSRLRTFVRNGSLRKHLNRYSFLALLFIGVLIFFVIKRSIAAIKHYNKWKDLPPLYGEYHQAELALPQHDTAVALNGQKYLWINNHVSALGWGNYLEDLIMNAQVAYSSGRGFVFDNQTWNRDNTEYSEFYGKVIPSQIPLSALISGPLIGGAFLDGDSTPRAIHKKFFDIICPNPTIVDTEVIRQRVNNENASAQTILNLWVDYLKSIEDPCVEIGRTSERIFDYYIYGHKERLLPIWPTLSKSPVMTLFGWSPLIQSAFEVNRALFSDIPLIESYTAVAPFTRSTDLYPTIPGLLVLHVRRGDFEEHCANLARWSATFNAFNSFDILPDQWTTPSGGGNGKTTDANMQYYMKQCYPSIEQIVRKVDEVRRSPEGVGLKDIYVMTNGKRSAVQLKKALHTMGGWNRVATSRDLTLTKHQKYVAQAVDMLIGQRAQVLVGNGFSSLTSDIVMMRMARKLPTGSNRFW